jgi:NADH-quinone oxidoreductase subunit C
MSALTNDLIRDSILQFNATCSTETALDGVMIVETTADQLLALLQYLRDDAVMGYHFLTTLNVTHYPGEEGRELSITYHLHNWPDNRRLRVRVWVSVADPVVPSATALFPAANWMERQEFDFFGVQFSGHPDLRRILNVDDLDVFPMRKEYRLEDGSRTDKDDRFFGREGNYEQRFD